MKNGKFLLELQESKVVDAIIICPRNGMNYIQPNHDYELFYWNKEWVSCGNKTPKYNFITYDEIPKGALLWLKNHTSGKEENVFRFVDGEQHFFIKKHFTFR